jgi:hypothetical protein
MGPNGTWFMSFVDSNGYSRCKFVREICCDFLADLWVYKQGLARAFLPHLRTECNMQTTRKPFLWGHTVPTFGGALFVASMAVYTKFTPRLLTKPLATRFSEQGKACYGFPWARIPGSPCLQMGWVLKKNSVLFPAPVTLLCSIGYRLACHPG